jgi:hypothetical protein
MAWDIRGIVSWPRFETDVPVLSRGDLRRFRLVAIDEPPEQFASLPRNAHH